MAAVSSPEWSFLTEQPEVVGYTVLLAVIWIALVSSIVLCASSLTTRRTLALAGAFAFFMVDQALAMILTGLTGDQDFLAGSLMLATQRVGNHLFGVESTWLTFDVGLAAVVLAGTTAAALAITAWRLRRLEVVA